ncbi:WD40 domain containing protein [Pyrrhoderma noxium]|uniref:WD40 domain containing protein n=1 Tax=Pyrrhoderma noxium TaxID=2282107 RepID=A0A286U853_9AGAM|nr:WD40 domain containing protein [Pyrrhoderma noxium]
MELRQSGSHASATIGTINDVGGNQTNIIHTLNMLSQDLDAHGVLIRRLGGKLSPSILPGDNRPECLKNTRIQTLREIYDWVDSTDRPNLFLLTGSPGTGKSTIATTVAETYRRKQRLGCHLFFTRGKSDPDNVLQTIAYNLAFYSQDIAQSLDEHLSKSGELTSATAESKFDILLCTPLSNITSKINFLVLIVLDAFDECGTPETRRSLMDALRDGLPKIPPNFRFLITGRPEQDILFLRTLSSSHVQTLVLDDRKGESFLDVQTYIRYELERLRSEKTWEVPDDWPWEKNLNLLADTADRLFIWASMAIKFISGKKLNQFGRLKALVSKQGKLDLSGLYATILRDALEWDEDADRNIFISILSLVLFGKSPLSDSTIDDFLGIETTSDVLSRLQSLIKYEKNKPIKIHHASFHDYIVSCEKEPWYIDVEKQKMNIIDKCFDRMGGSLRYNICDLQSPLFFNKDVPDLKKRIADNISSSLIYICRNWASHLRDVPYSQPLCSRLESFAYNQILFWFEVLSLTSTFKNHMSDVHHVIFWIGDNDPKLSLFLRNFSRRAVAVSKPMSESTLHIYRSFLPLMLWGSSGSKYARYADKAVRAECIGQKSRIDYIAELSCPSGPTVCLSFSPDGTRIVSGSAKGDIYVWGATTGKLIKGPLCCKSRVELVSFSLDGNHIISISEDCMIRKWDIQTNEPINGSSVLEGHKDPYDSFKDSKESVTSEDAPEAKMFTGSWKGSIVLSPCRELVIFGVDEGQICIWNVETEAMDRLTGHTDFISSLSFSSDGRYLASGSKDKAVIIWDVRARQVKTGPLIGHTDSVLSLSFSAGNTMASGSKDRTIRIWDVFTGSPLRVIDCRDNLRSVTYSPNGSLIATVGDNWMRIWILDNITASPRVIEVGMVSPCISFAPDYTRFASVTDGCIDLWEVGCEALWETPLSTKELMREVLRQTRMAIWLTRTKTTNAAVKAFLTAAQRSTLTTTQTIDLRAVLRAVLRAAKIAVLAEARTAAIRAAVRAAIKADRKAARKAILKAVLTIDRRAMKIAAEIAALKRNQIKAHIEAHITTGRAAQSAALTADRKAAKMAAKIEELASVLGNAEVAAKTVFLIADLPVARRVVEMKAEITKLTATLKEALTLVANTLAQEPETNFEATINRLNIAGRGTNQMRSLGIHKRHNPVAVSASGNLIASESLERNICLWDVTGGKLVSKSKDDYRVTSIVFSPIDERLIAFGLYNGSVNVWDATSDETSTIGEHSQIVNSVAFSADGKHIASGSDDKIICTWDVGLRKPAAGPLIGHTGSVISIAYSSDGKTIASGSGDTTVRIWDSETGLLSTFRGHFGSVHSVAYSCDGKRIVSGSGDSTIIVWDSQSGQIVCGPITGHCSVESVSFSPDGKQILSGFEDETAHIWDASSGRPLSSPFEGNKGITFDLILIPSSFHSVTFFPDGRHFATVSRERIIRIWTLDESPNNVSWRLRDDNWIVGKNDELLMWIPTELRDQLCPPRNIKMLNVPFYIKLHFNPET